jgi:peptide/nickel transport system substrate-binding protein
VTMWRGHIDRRALFSSAAAAALLAASGVSAAGAPVRGGRLRMALSGAARTDDWDHGDGLFMQIARQGLVFDTLTEVAADGTLRAELATRWQSRNACCVWQFDLREGVDFHDGTPLTARDVVASLSPLIAGDVVAKSALSVEIALYQPMSDLPLILSQPEYVIRAAHDSAGAVGTGLFEVVHFVPGQRLLTKRVGAHFKDGLAGWFDQVELTSIPSEAVRGQALGEYLVDVVDLHDASVVSAFDDITLMPDAARPSFAVLSEVAQPARISALRPLDNLRAAERWWFAQS